MASAAQAVGLSSGALVNQSAKVYRGFAVRETAGASAALRVWDGPVSTGVLLDTVSLAANESAREWYGAEVGIWVPSGVINVEKVSGSYEGSIRVG